MKPRQQIAPTPSIASTASAAGYACASPVAPEFVVNSEETPQGSLSQSILKVIFGHESFVVVHPITGLVLVSVCRVSSRELAVSTPDGRLIGNVMIRIASSTGGGRKQPWFEFRHCGNGLARIRALYDGEDNIVVKDSESVEICRINRSSEKFVGSVRRGTDLVLVCVLVSAIAFPSHT
jgi:hypothetical protein